MTSFLPVVGILVATAFTPRPNNLIVLDAGARQGLAAVGAVIFGVILGSLCLPALTWSGLGIAMRTVPSFEAVLSITDGD